MQERSTRGQRGGEAAMRAEKVSAAQLQIYLKGISYPADKSELVERARDNGAPDNVINMLEKLPDKDYRRPTEVEEEFNKMK